MNDPVFNFDLPANASPEMVASTEFAVALDALRCGMQALAEDHVALRERIQAADKSKRRPGPPSVRWAELDRPAAAEVWTWLIGWVRWFVDRYDLHEELGSCWPQHPPLVEELTALCLAWHGAYAPAASTDAPLRWHESLARSRPRLAEWDQHTKCRHGRHTDRPAGYGWPAAWLAHAYDAVQADGLNRHMPAERPAGPTKVAASDQVPTGTDAGGVPS